MKDMFMVPFSVGEFCFPEELPGSGGELRPVGLDPPESEILARGSGVLEREFDFDLDLDLLFLDRELLLDDFPPFFFALVRIASCSTCWRIKRPTYFSSSASMKPIPYEL